jgi:hypothetical protein
MDAVMSEDYVIKDWEDFHISELIEISEKYGMKLGTISRDSDSKKEENWSLVQKLEDVKDILVILYNGNGVQVGFGEERIGNFTSYGSNQVDEIFTILESESKNGIEIISVYSDYYYNNMTYDDEWDEYIVH